MREHSSFIINYGTCLVIFFFVICFRLAASRPFILLALICYKELIGYLKYFSKKIKINRPFSKVLTGVLYVEINKILHLIAYQVIIDMGKSYLHIYMIHNFKLKMSSEDVFFITYHIKLNFNKCINLRFSHC